MPNNTDPDLIPVQKLLSRHESIVEGQLCEVDGVKLVVSRNVLSPALTNTSRFFAEHVKTNPNARCFEVGVGTGFNLIKLGVTVPDLKLAGSDISVDAVLCTQANLALNGLTGDIYLGDLFGPRMTAVYDLILFNPPLIFGSATSTLELAVFDEDGSTVKRFCEQVGSHSHESTVIYMVYTNHQYRWGSADEFIIGQFEKNELSWERIASKDVGYEVYTVYELMCRDR